MADFNKSASDLPTVDKDGNAITAANPLTLEDVLVRLIERTDPVLGARVDGILNMPADSPYNWALLGLFLRDIFMDTKIDSVRIALETQISTLESSLTDYNPTLGGATEDQSGVAELADQTEGRSGSNHDRIMTSLRTLDAIRNGTAFSATTDRRGVVELATGSQTLSGSSSTLAVTPSGLRYFADNYNFS